MEPWSVEKRRRIARKIEKEAERASARIGAAGVVIIAFFQDGDFIHMQDAGHNEPMDLEKIYAQMLSVRGVLRESGGDDVALQ